jgi:hypothetical protein
MIERSIAWKNIEDNQAQTHRRQARKPGELAEESFRLYEHFRPSIPEGVAG